MAFYLAIRVVHHHLLKVQVAWLQNKEIINSFNFKFFIAKALLMKWITSCESMKNCARWCKLWSKLWATLTHGKKCPGRQGLDVILLNKIEESPVQLVGSLLFCTREEGEALQTQSFTLD